MTNRQSVALFTLVTVLAQAVGATRVLGLSCASMDPCSSPRAEDTMVVGCPAVDPGSVGIETVLGNDGQTVSVGISVVAANRIDAYLIDLTYPTDLLQFQSASPGSLIQDFISFGANPFPGGVRFGGVGGPAFIEEGETGEIAVLTFTVTNPGCGAFCFLNLWDHVAGYSTCEGVSSGSIAAGFDLKPGRCPNRSPLLRDVLRSVVAGSNQLNVNEIDQATVRLRVKGQANPTVAPSSQSIMVTDDPIANDCECSASPPDAIDDLVLEFASSEVRQLLASSPGNAPADLEIVGVLNDGTEFSGSDCLGVVQVESVPLLDDRFDAHNQAYRVINPGHVRLSLFDVTGRMVGVLVDAPRAAGVYSFDLKAAGVTSGVYFVRYETPEATTTHKVVFVR